tara:strand:+ start:943 stop:1230 length:288 start_codon:yes stop_codon:yes gene_type:complete
MNKYLFSYSESILLSLCKEIEFIKTRSRNINCSLKTCQNKRLSKRLRLELDKLNKNRQKILTISESMFNRNSKDLSYEFLLEITKRSGTFSANIS